MIVVVTGSRSWAGWPWPENGRGPDVTARDHAQFYALTSMLDGLRTEALATMSDFRLIHGDCPTGADKLALHWCSRRTQVHEHIYHANWDKHGKAAGPIRNRDMIDWVVGEDDGTFVIACYEGLSKGTRHCSDYAKSKGLEVIELRSR